MWSLIGVNEYTTLVPTENDLKLMANLFKVEEIF